MAGRDGYAVRLKPACARGGIFVTTRDVVAAFLQEECQSRHAHAADALKVNVPCHDVAFSPSSFCTCAHAARKCSQVGQHLERIRERA